MRAGNGAERKGRTSMLEKLLKMIGLGKKVKREIIVNAESLETRVAVLEDGHLE